jgi:hypothetical protein
MHVCILAAAGVEHGRASKLTPTASGRAQLDEIRVDERDLQSQQLLDLYICMLISRDTRRLSLFVARLVVLLHNDFVDNVFIAFPSVKKP